MKNFRSGFIYAIIVSALWLSGCATTKSESETAELQRNAMLRWNACLERHTQSNKFPSLHVNRLLRQDCEGYKRDVIALFPRHMASHVDHLLVSSAYRYIESTEESTKEPTHMSDLMKTVLR